MNNIYLPELKSIEIKNFTLYPNGLNFKYDFVNGVNLIVGGNGMGKTTFVNIIKYAIIGHYKEGYDFTRTYLGRKIEKRTNHPWNYFRKRMDESISNSFPATVKIIFHVNGVEFKIERGLSDIQILEVSVDNVTLNGELIDQATYDRLYYDYSREKNKDLAEQFYNKLSNSLPFKFERSIEQYSNMQFDDLIYFVNKILFFGEDHQTILWGNNSSEDVQTELFNKYFNDRNLNIERQEANRWTKYYDTQARHTSEDIRVIRKVLDKVTDVDDINTSINQVRDNIERLKEERENLSDLLEQNQTTSKETDRDLRLASNNVNELSQEVSQIEIRQKNEESILMQNQWITLHKNYHNFVKSISSNALCPMCNQELEESFVTIKTENNENCILCDQKLHKNAELDIDTNFKDKLISIKVKIQNYQNFIYECDDKLKRLDNEFRKGKQRLREINSKVRNLEYSLVEKENNKKDNPTDKLQAFYDEIDELELKKEHYQEESKTYKNRSQEITDKIEEEIIKNVLNFSTIFAGYAEKFLGVKCSLTYDEIDGQKRFYPVIDGKIREREEELSESQRFFVDHAFRMSILSFFYKTPSFYIVETPDSSLDISYERNAADVFIRFLEKPYALILTTNLNNSEFLNYLAKSANTVSTINLLQIGKKSPIQDNNQLLGSILNKVQIKIKY